MNTAHRSPASLKDVASAAGVSVSTASRALNGKATEFRISEETAQAVQKAADQLEFRPSQVARSLRSKKTGLLGVVLPDVANPFFAAIAREITVVAGQNDLSVLLTDSRDNSQTEARLVRQLRSRQVEALLVCPVGLVSQHLQEVDTAGLPTVLIDRGFVDSRIATVTTDHRDAADALTSLLVQQGHQHIGVLQGAAGTMPNEERIAGIRRALQNAGHSLSDSCVRGIQFSEQSGHEATHWILKHHPDTTAFVGLSNQNSLGALRALRELGLRIPEDISLVTFDDHPFAEFLSTPLTTAHQNTTDLGQRAAQLIVDRLQSGRRSRKKMHRVPVQIIERASISAPRTV